MSDQNREILPVELEGLFVDTLFDRLNQSQINYTVLRNYEGLPHDIGNDVDFLVKSTNITTFEDLLVQIARELNWQLLELVQRLAFRSYTFGFVMLDASVRLLKLDVWYPITWKGIEWIDCNELVNTRIPFGNFYVPEPGFEAFLICLKDVLHVGRMREKHKARITDLLIASPDSFLTAVRTGWDADTASWLYECAIAENWSAIEAGAGRLRKGLLLKSMKRRPLKTVVEFTRFGIAHFRYMASSHSGMFVCFIGPDGSGKSTASSELTKELAGVFRGYRYYHGRFGIMPELGGLRRRVATGAQKPIEVSYSSIPPHSGRLRTYVYMAYYIWDFILGYELLRRMRRRGNLICMDRYFYDYVIQPGPLTVDSSIFQLGLRLAPNPDLIIYLSAPADVIFRRKPELTIGEISRQQSICTDLANTLSNATIIDNSVPLIDAKRQVLTSVLKKIEDQVSRRSTLCVHNK